MTSPEELQLYVKGVDAAIQTARDYADVLVKPSLAQLGGILSDPIGQWRLRNQARMLVKTKQILEQNGINPEAMLPDVFVPIVDAAGNTSDELLSDMFASLLARHADPASVGHIHPSYARVLEQFSSEDAVVFRMIYKHQCDVKAGKVKYVYPEDGDSEIPIDPMVSSLSVENLIRLAIVERSITNIFAGGFDPTGYQITPYGIKFGDACIAGL